jgi:hypothetical protein
MARFAGVVVCPRHWAEQSRSTPTTPGARKPNACAAAPNPDLAFAGFFGLPGVNYSQTTADRLSSEGCGGGGVRVPPGRFGGRG